MVAWKEIYFSKGKYKKLSNDFHENIKANEHKIKFAIPDGKTLIKLRSSL